MHIWIGYAHPDRLLTYPDRRNLSGCSLPIRMFVTYPDVMASVGPRLPFPDESAFGLVAQWCDATVSGVSRPVGPRRRFQSVLANFARNSSAASSNLEFTSLELQRFEGCSKNDRGKLCATFSGKPGDSVVAVLWSRRGPPGPGFRRNPATAS